MDLTARVDSPDLLDDIERQRAARLRFEYDRIRFVAARAALRSILGGILGRSPKQLIFQLGSHGKPSLRETQGLEFNMSHSGDLALVAVSRNEPVGVDIEVSRQMPRARELARRYLHPDEIRTIETVPPDSRSPVFLTCWTRKEAVLKSTGAGLTLNTQLLNVGALADEKVLDLPGFPRLRVTSFEPVPGYIAACATAPDTRVIEFFQYPSSEKNCAP